MLTLGLDNALCEQYFFRSLAEILREREFARINFSLEELKYVAGVVPRSIGFHPEKTCLPDTQTLDQFLKLRTRLTLTPQAQVRFGESMLIVTGFKLCPENRRPDYAFWGMVMYRQSAETAEFSIGRRRLLRAVARHFNPWTQALSHVSTHETTERISRSPHRLEP